MSAPSAFQPKLGTLPPPQRALWHELAPAAKLGFVLYGGTAVALRVGHRASVDFDFFSERALDHRAVRAAMPWMAPAQVLQESVDTLTVVTGSAPAGATGVKVSFFGSIGFGRVGTPGVTGDGVVQVASLDDLMGTKLKVILQRVEAKDYLDIAAMLGAGATLADGLAAAKALFGTAFQPSESLKALTWFEGGDLATLPASTQATLVKAASAVRDLPATTIASRQLAAAVPPA